MPINPNLALSLSIIPHSNTFHLQYAYIQKAWPLQPVSDSCLNLAVFELQQKQNMFLDI